MLALIVMSLPNAYLIARLSHYIEITRPTSEALYLFI